MQVIRITGRLLLAIFRLAMTLVLSAGFLVLIVPGILVLHLLERFASKRSAPDRAPRSANLAPEPAF